MVTRELRPGNRSAARTRQFCEDVRMAGLTALARAAALTGGRSGPRIVGAALAVAGAAALAVALLTGSGHGGPPATGPSCVAVDGVLPAWARGGFSDPEPVQPHVLGDHGEIVGVLWGPLSAPPTPDLGNKILWVAREPSGGPLVITAHRGTEPPTVQVLPDGPGPSNVDLPAPGCWTLDLTWPGHTDSVRLPYDR